MLNILFFSFGIAAASCFPSLPTFYVVYPALALALGMVRRLRVVACLGLGLCWGFFAGQSSLDSQLPEELEGVDILVHGDIIDLPQSRERGQRFLLRIDHIETDVADHYRLPAKALISAYNDQHYAVGQRWQLVLRLKRPRALVNDGGFDYHRWLLSRRITGTGYIRASDLNTRLEQLHAYPVQILRADIRQWILNTAPADVQGPLLALAVGDNSYINAKQWQLFRATGTGHLMAISGLHIGLVAVFGLVFGRLLATAIAATGKQFSCLRYLPNLLSCLTAVAYAALAGFGLPTQRALVMVVLFNAAFVLGRGHQPGRALVLAAAVVLLLDPLAAWDMGFWLSFGAVAVLLGYFNNRYRAQPHRLDNSRQFVRAQAVVFVGLLLPLLAFNTSLSLYAPVANLVVIPLVSFAAVLPLLMAMALKILGFGFGVPALLLKIAGLTLRCAEMGLAWLASLPVPEHWSPNGVVALPLVILAVFGVVSVLLARGFPGRWLGCLLLLPLLLPASKAQAPLTLTVLDVGQGLAIVVRTPEHTLLYDTGARFSERFDTGEAVVLAYLRRQGIHHLDTMMISHGDNDHAGGAGAVLAGMRVDKVISGEILPDIKHSICDRDQHWQWEAVSFDLIEPRIVAKDNNNMSCVLLLTIGGQRILLPGDIEAPVERALLAQQDLPQPVQVLLAPHHGSNTSSSKAFVKQLRPEHVVFSAGYRSRYGHPHPRVTARYQDLGSAIYNTATDGQIDFVWNRAGEVKVTRRRRFASRYWY